LIEQTVVSDALNRVRRGIAGGQTNIFPVDGGRRSQLKSRRCSCQGSTPVWTGGSRRRQRHLWKTADQQHRAHGQLIEPYI